MCDVDPEAFKSAFPVTHVNDTSEITYPLHSLPSWDLSLFLLLTPSGLQGAIV